ncbi:hypothetical protein NL676_003230 [Syzygium grande]|nr:hypothetical protein NL676_003230 [Syzygium grande]
MTTANQKSSSPHPCGVVAAESMRRQRSKKSAPPPPPPPPPPSQTSDSELLRSPIAVLAARTRVPIGEPGVVRLVCGGSAPPMI